MTSDLAYPALVGGYPVFISNVFVASNRKLLNGCD
jgi:hypothetical protein